MAADFDAVIIHIEPTYLSEAIANGIVRYFRSRGRSKRFSSRCRDSVTSLVSIGNLVQTWMFWVKVGFNLNLGSECKVLTWYSQRDQDCLKTLGCAANGATIAKARLLGAALPRRNSRHQCEHNFAIFLVVVDGDIGALPRPRWEPCDCFRVSCRSHLHPPDVKTGFGATCYGVVMWPDGCWSDSGYLWVDSEILIIWGHQLSTSSNVVPKKM